MTLQVIRDFLLLCLILNVGFLLFWFLAFSLAHKWIYWLHGRWFALSKEQFDSLHYQGMATFKIIVIVFNLVPYLALLIMK